jgi:glycosyltransferase involved in cell wall biosynthesis
MSIRLAIICTHPIQYFAPAFAALAARPEIELRVFYGWRGATESAFDHDFRRSIIWDVPLLEGYDYEFVDNIASDPGSHHFRGIDLPSLPHRVRNWGADALLVYGWCYKAHLNALRVFHGQLPILFRGDSTLLDERPGVKIWLRRRLLRWIYRHVDIALYVGKNNEKYFVAHGLRADQLVFAPHAVDNDRFANNAEARSAGSRLRAHYGISEEDLVVLFAGKVERKKAPDLLIRSIARLSDARVHLLIAGTGDLQSALRSHAPTNTHFLGFQNQSEMPACYYASDLVVLPSRGPGETWGLALNEAMACGRAVIASDRVGAAVDLIQPGKNGWVFPAEDELALTECLRQALMCGRPGLQRMGLTSRSIVARWSISEFINGVIAAVARTIQPRNKA